MAREEPPNVYYRFVADLPPGNYTHPIVGEVSPGAIYKLRTVEAAPLEGDPNWRKVDAQKFEKQENIATAEEQS